jgi:hypothetical protein
MPSSSTACRRDKMRRVMGAFKRRKLVTNAGSRVSSRPQAIAIGLSEARKRCGAGPGARSAVRHTKRKPLRLHVP